MKFPPIPELYSVFKQHPQVITDSRKVPAGALFFALRGDNFNGNRFAEAALQQGCSFAVIDDEKFYSGSQCILVKDGLTALQELAKHHRRHLKIPFLAITGSNGKTTTKELIKSVLSAKYKVLATEGNLNNHIGVPLTLLSITGDIEIAVIEMGANHRGEISRLCEIALPDYGLITNIGKAHLGEFGSFEDIVKAKTEMYKNIKESKGKIFINADNELLVAKAAKTESITYGTAGEVFASVRLVSADPYLKIEFEGETISTQLIGKYNFENVAAAICTGKYFGVDASKIKRGIEEYISSNNRSQVVQTKKNTLILDAYNANPSSMSEALENFSEAAPEGRWLILGDMLELGTYEMEEHKKILELVRNKKFQHAVFVGERFAEAIAGSGFSIPGMYLYRNADELIKALQTAQLNIHSAQVLIKGSRGIRLERAAEYL